MKIRRADRASAGRSGRCQGRRVWMVAAMALVAVTGCGDSGGATDGSPNGSADLGPLPSGMLPQQSGAARVSLAGRDETAVQVVVPTPRPAHPPLLLVFHGTGGEPTDAVNDFDLQARANALGFVAIAPRAAYRDKPHPPDVDHPADWGGSSWNLWTLDAARNEDLAYLRLLIDAAVASWGADPKRVYTMGFSNGAYMSWFAAASMPDRIAGFAENSGGWATDSCPTRTDADGASQYLLTSVASPGQAVTCPEIFAQPEFPTRCRIGPANKLRPPTPAGRVPFGLLGHYASDDSVSVVWSCLLAESLGARGKTRIRNKELDGTAGHSVIPGFVDEAFAFFANRTVSD